MLIPCTEVCISFAVAALMLIPWMDHVEAQPLPSWNGSCENHAELL